MYLPQGMTAKMNATDCTVTCLFDITVGVYNRQAYRSSFCVNCFIKIDRVTFVTEE